MRIEWFDGVQLYRESPPCWEGYCKVTRELRLREPLSARLLPEGMEVSGYVGRRNERVVQLVRLDQGKSWARLMESSPSRGAIIGGVAAASALAVGIGVGAIVQAGDDGPHEGLAAVYAGVLSGSAAGGLSLVFTFPLTKDLGEVLE